MNALLLVAILRFAGDDPEYLGKPVFAWRDDLDSRDTAVRLRALTVLSEIHIATPGVVEGLRVALRDPDPFLRHMAVRKLIDGRGVDDVTRELILKLVDDPDPGVKLEARRLIVEARPRPGGGEVFGVGGLPLAKSVVYVLDGSLSMRDEGDFVTLQLAKAVKSLNSTQRFGVLVFREGEVEAIVDGPSPATEAFKQVLFTKLADVVFSGTSDPRAALKKALAMKMPDGKPVDVIYLLTDGLLDDEHLDEITKLNNAGGKPGVRINAIIFDEEDGASWQAMQRFTEANRGRQKAVVERD